MTQKCLVIIVFMNVGICDRVEKTGGILLGLCVMPIPRFELVISILPEPDKRIILFNRMTRKLFKTNIFETT